MVERLRAELPAGLTPLGGDRLAWQCSKCEGRFSLSEIRQAAAAVDLLIDAAQSHHC